MTPALPGREGILYRTGIDSQGTVVVDQVCASFTFAVEDGTAVGIMAEECRQRRP